MSRENMRGLKAKIEEDERLQKVGMWLRCIYDKAVNLAKTTLDTSFNFPIPPDHLQGRPRAAVSWIPPSDPFFLANMPDILSGLRQLFPGCTVTHSLLCQGTDGKLYDISTLDDKVLPFVNRALDRSFIVIDWS